MIECVRVRTRAAVATQRAVQRVSHAELILAPFRADHLSLFNFKKYIYVYISDKNQMGKSFRSTRFRSHTINTLQSFHLVITIEKLCIFIAKLQNLGQSSK